MDGPDYDRETGEVVEPRRELPALPEVRQPQSMIFASPECAQVFAGLCEFQGSCEAPRKTKTAKVQGKSRAGNAYEYSYAYAPLEEIHSVIRAPMKTAGLAYRQFLAVRDRQWVMRTVIGHQSGEWFGCDYPIFWDQDRGMQGFASGVTYARRYGLMLALGIVGEDDDDANVADGNVAAIAPTARGERAGRSYPPRREAAPAPSTERAEADKRFREIRDDIDQCSDPVELARIDGCPAWTMLESWLERAGANVAESLAMLRARIEKRRRELQQGGSPYPLPDSMEPGP